MQTFNSLLMRKVPEDSEVWVFYVDDLKSQL
jgi:hypothetical protein